MGAIEIVFMRGTLVARFATLAGVSQMESSVTVLCSSCCSVVMYLLREIYSSILLGENIHTLVLPFEAYTRYH